MLSAWKVVQSLTVIFKPPLSGIPVMPPSRGDYTIKENLLQRDLGQLAEMIFFNGSKLT